MGLSEEGPWQQALRDEEGGGEMVWAEVRACVKALGRNTLYLLQTWEESQCGWSRGSGGVAVEKQVSSVLSGVLRGLQALARGLAFILDVMGSH